MMKPAERFKPPIPIRWINGFQGDPSRTSPQFDFSTKVEGEIGPFLFDG